jgi:hypothetical protein
MNIAHPITFTPPTHLLRLPQQTAPPVHHRLCSLGRFQPTSAFLNRHFNTHPALTLHTAVLHNNLPLILSLLTSNHDINKFDDTPGTLDHYGTPAAHRNMPAAFGLLLIRGADADMLDAGSEECHGETPIRLAVPA